MQFRSKYGEPIARCLMAYPQPALQIAALEVLIQTALERQTADSIEELAAKTCRGMHLDKPGRGVVCSKCYEAVSRTGGRKEDAAPDEKVESGVDPEFVKGLLAG